VSKFPSQDQMRFFVEQYLQAFNPNEVGLNSLLKDVANRIPKVHNYWINWAKNGFSGQVDYEKYALNRQKLLNVDLL
jgi:hypothetical protein